MVNARVLTIGLAGILAGCSGDPSAPDQASATAYPTAPILSKKTLESGGAEIEPRRLFATEIASEEPDRLTEPVVERGTGRVIGQPRSSAAPGVNRNEAGDLTLNVVDADIRDVVRLVLEDGLNANYVIDPAVTGTITIRTSRPIPADDVTSMLNSVLNLNGASLIQQDGLYKVLPSDQAITAGGRPGTRTSAVAGRAGAGIQVAPIRHADAAQLAELLQPFTANQGSVQVDASRNTLLILGSADQNATINELIDMFDVDWMAGMSFGLYPLKAVGSTQLVSELDQVFGDPDTGVAAGALRFVPLDRLNALLAIAAQPDHLDRVEDWIERLDKVGDGEGEQVYVYDSMRYLVLSVPLPVKAGVVEASPEKPFMSLVFEIDTAAVSELLLEVDQQDASPDQQTSSGGVPGMYVSRIDEELTGAVIRLLRALDDPTDLSVLGPQYSREILYRVLRGEQGHLLRTAALAASQSHRVAQVIHYMESNYEQPLDIPTLAREAGMSTSSLHHTFKEVTSMSPLQYLKQIRLHRARLIMLEQGSGAGQAAYQVGYASPSQFSREFKRLFGQSPRQEVQQFRELQASP